jgi:hypothetical protein
MKWLAPHRTLRVQRINLSHTVPEVVPAEVFAQAKAAFKDRVGGEIAVPAWDLEVDGDEPESHRPLCFEHPDHRWRVHHRAGVSQSGLAAPGGT